jgi:probable HAF family extracellular repeat protein
MTRGEGRRGALPRESDVKKVIRIVAITFAVLAISVRLGAKPEQGNFHHYKLVDLGTFGGPASYFNLGAGIVTQQGTAVGWADTSTPDPFPEFCFSANCQVSHGFQWHMSAPLADLGALTSGNSSAALWISPNGLVAGVSENGTVDPLDSSSPTYRAVLWRDGTIADLGALEGGSTSWASAVNSPGQVVGFSENGIPDSSPLAAQFFGFPATTQTRAFLWLNGEMRDLGTLGGPDAVAAFVNEEGQVAGYSYTDSTPNASTGLPTLDPFFWEQGRMVDIGTLGGAFGDVNWLNNHGQVVGDSDLTGDLVSHAFLWQGGNLKDLGTLGGDTASPGYISDSGDIVGKADLPGPAPQNHHAILWTSGRKIDLGVLKNEGDVCSRAFWVNSSGQVVGNSESETLCDVSGEHAFLWQDGSPMVDLNSLIPADSPLELSHAFVITDRGEIAGLGVPSGCDPSNDFVCGHAYVLIPCDDDHPSLEGCDYSLVDSATAAEFHHAQITQAPVSGARQLKLSPAEMIARFRTSMVSRNHRYGTRQSLPE